MILMSRILKAGIDDGAVVSGYVWERGRGALTPAGVGGGWMNGKLIKVSFLAAIVPLSSSAIRDGVTCIHPIQEKQRLFMFS